MPVLIFLNALYAPERMMFPTIIAVALVVVLGATYWHWFGYV
ncbi:MAG TPA: hypothetical protein VIV34_04375 [Pseudolabrys sp.]